jgi:hypothetical protein
MTPVRARVEVAIISLENEGRDGHEGHDHNLRSGETIWYSGPNDTFSGSAKADICAIDTYTARICVDAAYKRVGTLQGILYSQKASCKKPVTVLITYDECVLQFLHKKKKPRATEHSRGNGSERKFS